MVHHALKVLQYGEIIARLEESCECALGAALAEDLQPSFDPSEVWRRLSETEEAYKILGLESPPSLGGVRDVETALRRASKGGLLGGDELYQVGTTLAAMRAMRSFLAPKAPEAPNLAVPYELLPELTLLENKLLTSLESNGDVRSEASVALGQVRKRKASLQQRLMDRVQQYATGKTRDLLSDPIFTVRDGRYVIPLKAENRGKIRGIVHDTSATGQTIFVEPEDVLAMGNGLREAEAEERAEINRILLKLSEQVGQAKREISQGLGAVAQIDFAFAKARLAYAMKGTLPERLQGASRVEIQGGKHPLLDPAIVIPLDIEMGEKRGVLITGPNTGGKTVAIKTVGLLSLMAQSGLAPTALSFRFSPFRQAWADIGDEQSLSQSLSTFSGHIKNIAEALRSLLPGALVLLDEVGAGTDPAEGAALARSILMELSDGGACVMASTHYGELKAFAYEDPRFTNAAMEFDPKTLQPTYRLRLGAPGASQALRIAEKYGIPKKVVERAREGLGAQHQDIALMLERLEQAQKQARSAQAEADRRAAELRKQEEIASRKLAEADDIRANVHARATQKIEDALRELRLEAEEIFEELKKRPQDQKALDEARGRLRGIQELGRDAAREYQPKKNPTPPSDEPLTKGMTVRIEGVSQPGILLDEPKGKTAQVLVGALKMNVPIEDIRPAKAAAVVRKPKPNVTLQKTLHAVTELNLRMMRAEYAEIELEKYLDESVLAGVPSVRIIHGKGEGILRELTRKIAKKHRDVESFRDADPAEGGQGATIIVFKP